MKVNACSIHVNSIFDYKKKTNWHHVTKYSSLTQYKLITTKKLKKKPNLNSGVFVHHFFNNTISIDPMLTVLLKSHFFFKIFDL